MQGEVRVRLLCTAIMKLVGVTGFEPATPASRTQCSTRLSYTPTRCEKWRGKHSIGGFGLPLACHDQREKRAPLYASGRRKGKPRRAHL